MLRGTLLVKQALIMQLIRLISSLSKNPRIKVCTMQKRSPVPIFSQNLLLQNGTFMAKTVSGFHDFDPPYIAMYVI